jgi:hypothetical protein
LDPYELGPSIPASLDGQLKYDAIRSRLSARVSLSGLCSGKKRILGVEALETGHRSFQRRCARALVGHKNLETTQTYLGVPGCEKLCENINAAFEPDP